MRGGGRWGNRSRIGCPACPIDLELPQRPAPGRAACRAVHADVTSACIQAGDIVDAAISGRRCEDRRPGTGIAGDLDLVAPAVSSLPAQYDACHGGVSAEVHIDPLAVVPGIAGPASGSLQVDGLVRRTTRAVRIVLRGRSDGRLVIGE